MYCRVLLSAFVGTFLVAPIFAHAQQAKKLPRLCFMTYEPGTFHARSARFDVFFQALHNLGYVDGKTINIDYLYAEDQGERYLDIAAECVRLNADVIVVSSTPAAHAAKKATGTIPIVMVALGDPVGTGLVNSLARPGGNVTGMSLMASALAAKRLALLKELVPGISRVLVLSYLIDPIAPLQIEALKEAAPSLGLTLDIRDVRTAEDLPSAFDAGVKAHCQGLLLTAESIFLIHRARVTELAASHRLPAIYPYSPFVVDSAGLMAYDVDIPDLHGHAATYVDQILKGAKPSELPVQQPTKIELFINSRTAKALGLTIPPLLLVRADQVIE